MRLAVAEHVGGEESTNLLPRWRNLWAISTCRVPCGKTGPLRPFLHECNLTAWLNQPCIDSQLLGRSKEDPFGIWPFSIERRIVKCPIVHGASDFGLQYSGGCRGLIWHEVRRDAARFHARKLRDRAVDRQECGVRNAASRSDLPPIPMP